ncbi:MAG: GNAT family N-acetyltransferase [Candidatus Sulfotelmatobacter sp.]
MLRLLGDGSGDSDNLDFIVRPGFEEAFAKSILQHLRQRRPYWDVCLLNTLPLNSPVADCLAKLLGSSPLTFFQYSSKSSAMSLPENWDLYSQVLSSEDRKNLGRYMRRLQARHSVRIHRCTMPDELPGCLDALFRLHQGRWQSAGQPGSFSSAERRGFYEQLSRCLLDRGWLELWALELDNQIAAVQFAFRYGDRVFQLQEGYDHARTSDRLGFVLRGEVLKQLIVEKVRTYDFLGGEDPYKIRWGARPEQYRQLHFAPSIGIGGAWLQWVDKTGRSKEWLRQKVPIAVWGILQRTNAAFRKSSSSASRNPNNPTVERNETKTDRVNPAHSI